MEASMTGDELTNNKTISDVIEDIIGQVSSAHSESPTITSITPPTPPQATAEIPPQLATTINTTTANTTATTTATTVTATVTATITTTTTATATNSTTNTTITSSTDLNGQPQPAVEQNGGSSVGSSSEEKPKRKRRSSTLLSDVESSETSEGSGGRTKRARTKTQLFQSPAQIVTRISRSASQSDFDDTLSEKSKEDSQKKKVEYEKYQILAVRSESGFYLCRTAQGSRSNSDLKIEWLDSKDDKHYTLTKHFDKVTHASVLAELYLEKLKLQDQRSRTYILDDDSRNIIEKALKDSLKLGKDIGKDKAEPCQAEIKLNDSKEEPPSTRRRRSTRNS